MNYFKTDDNVKLAYTDKGSGIPVVLISGYGAPAVGWCSQEKALVKAGYRVICYDRRSHGASENPNFGQNMLRQGQDINCLLEHLSVDKAVLIGQSQGSSSIFSYISQFGTSRLIAICDIDQTPKMMNDADWPHGMYKLDAETRPTYFDTPLPPPNKAPIDKGVVARVLAASLKYKKFDMDNTRPLLLDHADANWLPVLPAIDVPAYFIAGAESPFWPKEHAKASAELCPKGSYIYVEGSGHAVNWEFPAKTNEILIDFLKSI